MNKISLLFLVSSFVLSFQSVAKTIIVEGNIQSNSKIFFVNNYFNDQTWLPCESGQLEGECVAKIKKSSSGSGLYEFHWKQAEESGVRILDNPLINVKNTLGVEYSLMNFEHNTVNREAFLKGEKQLLNLIHNHQYKHFYKSAKLFADEASRVFGERHPYTSRAIFLLSQSRFLFEELDLSKKYLERVVDNIENEYGFYDVEFTANVYQMLASIYFRQGDLEKEGKYYDKFEELKSYSLYYKTMACYAENLAIRSREDRKKAEQISDMIVEDYNASKHESFSAYLTALSILSPVRKEENKQYYELYKSVLDNNFSLKSLEDLKRYYNLASLNYGEDREYIYHKLNEASRFRNENYPNFDDAKVWENLGFSNFYFKERNDEKLLKSYVRYLSILEEIGNGHKKAGINRTIAIYNHLKKQGYNLEP